MAFHSKIPGLNKIHNGLQKNFTACMAFHSKIPGVEWLMSCLDFNCGSPGILPSQVSYMGHKSHSRILQFFSKYLGWPM